MGNSADIVFLDDLIDGESTTPVTEMTRKSKAFRLRLDTILKIERLSERWKMPKQDVIDRLVDLGDRRLIV